MIHLWLLVNSHWQNCSNNIVLRESRLPLELLVKAWTRTEKILILLLGCHVGLTRRKVTEFKQVVESLLSRTLAKITLWSLYKAI